MAEQQISTIRRALAAVGVCAALVLGHATNTTALLQLSNTVIALGGQGDTTSIRVRNKLDDTVVPPSYGYYGVPYPAGYELTKSSNVAVPLVNTYVTHTGKDEQSLIVAGYSEGALPAEQERRNLQKLPASSAPATDQLSFVMIASPFAPNGGIFGRFPGISIPFVVDNMGAAKPSRYDTTYSALEYDPYADFPAYFNPLALLNTALSVHYGHPDAYYDPLDPNTSPRYVTTVPDAGGGTDTYVLYYNPHLPLFAPVRQVAAMTHTSAFVEPLISAVEPLARVLVDMAYTDRTNANPGAAVHFSFITPPQKIVQALAAIPGALAQGVHDMMAGGRATATPTHADAVAAPAPTTTAVKPKPKRHDRPSAVATTTPDADPPHPTEMSTGNKFTPGKARKPKGSKAGTETSETKPPATPSTPAASSEQTPSAGEEKGAAAA